MSKYLRVQWVPSSMHRDLLTRVAAYLIRTGRLTPRQVEHVCTKAPSWWTRATLVEELELSDLGAATRDRIVQQEIREEARDVAIAAGWKAFVDGIGPTGPQRDGNHSGEIFLRELGLIKRRTASYCGIKKSFHKLDPKMPKVNWKKLLGIHYNQGERQAVEIAALSQTNITAFVNALDVFNEMLLDGLFTADGGIGSFTLGNIGSVLSSTTSKFAARYPSTFALASEVHAQRLTSMYSHARIRATSRPTHRIRYRFLGEAKKLMRSAVGELSAAGN